MRQRPKDTHCRKSFSHDNSSVLTDSQTASDKLSDMTVPHFTIPCTTCRVQINVHDLALIGQIVACPKCDSMVMVETPAEPPAADDAPLQDAETVDDLPLHDVTDDESYHEPLQRSVQVQLNDHPADFTQSSPSRPDDSSSPPKDDVLIEQPLLPNAGWTSSSSRAVTAWLLNGAAVLIGAGLAAGISLFYAIHRAESEPVVKETPTETPAVALVDQPPVSSADAASDDSLTRDDASLPERPAVEQLVPDSSPGDLPPDDKAVVDGASPTQAADTENTDSDESVFANIASETEQATAPPEFSAPNPPLSTDPSTASAQDDPLSPDLAVTIIPLDERPAPRVIDAKARLADVIPAIEFHDIALADFVHFLTQLTTVPITLDLQSMQISQVSSSRKVTYEGTNVTASKLLGEVLKPLRLEQTLVDFHVVIRRPLPSENGLRTVPHKVDDLADNLADAQQLATSVMRIAAPLPDDAIAAAQLPSDQIQVAVDQFVITRDEQTHLRVMTVLERLRLARGISPATKRGQALIDQTSPWKVREQLQQRRVTVSYLKPVRITTIARQIGQQLEMNIVFDWQRMESERWSPESTATCAEVNEPASDVLTRLFAPMGLGYLVVDGETIQITTAARAAAIREIDLYTLPEHLAADAIIAKLQARIPAASFFFDKTSRHVVVAAPQSKHATVAQSLAAGYTVE